MKFVLSFDRLTGAKRSVQLKLQSGMAVLGGARNATVLLVLALLPVIVNLVGFSKYASSDPLYLMSGLYAATTSNLLPGLPGWIDPNSGTNSQALGYLAAQTWLSGEVPWWNHYSGAGLPLAAAMQSHALFLPFILLMHFANGPLLLKISLQIVAGVAMYLLLRQIGMRKTAAFVGAVAYEFNGTFAWFSDSVMTTIAFLPLFILGIEYALDANKPRSCKWLAISIAVPLSLYAGFPETAYINGLLALTWACVRLIKSDASDRLSSLFKILFGGIVGLLLSAPLFVVFGGLLLESEVSHRLAMTARGLNANSFVAMLFPYFSGPISAFDRYDADPSVVDMWSNIGGYITLPFLTAAIFGAFGRSHRWLRVTLTGWSICSLLLVFWVLPTWNPIAYSPGMKFIAFFRYAWPSIEFCISILAAFFINDLREEIPQESRIRLKWGTAWLSVLTILLGVSLFTIRNQLTFFLATEFRTIFFLVTFISFVVIAMIPGCLMLVSSTNKLLVRISVTLLLITSIGCFIVPLLSGKRVSYQLPGSVTFLQENLGFNRFYTLGPFMPNYSAYFKLGSINDIYNPVPKRWATYVNSKLDPGASAGLFIGNWPVVAGTESRSEAFVRNVRNFELTGVKFVIAPSRSDPFVDFPRPTTSPSVPEAIPANEPFRDAIVLDPPRRGTLKSFSVYVGTYDGKADGDLVLDLCVASTCGHGYLPLKDVVDNSMATFVLDREIALENENRIEFSIRQNNSTHPIALWRWQDTKSTEKSLLSVNSKVAISLAFLDDRYRKVYEDAIVSIYQLSSPAAYIEIVNGHCDIVIENRNALKTNCDRPSTIMRREMFYPGWEATRNGLGTPISEAYGLFQAVEVPSGISDLRFQYSPPYMRVGFGGLGVGLLAMVLCFLLSRSRRLTTLSGHRRAVR